jgi:Hpt domain-containing protein
MTEGVFDRAAALMRVEALKWEDLKLLEQPAHTLKGSVSNFFAPVAYPAALKLEKIGREGNVEKAQEAWIDLERAMEQLRPALQLLRDEVVA